jgi:hypothetical protein
VLLSRAATGGGHALLTPINEGESIWNHLEKCFALLLIVSQATAVFNVPLTEMSSCFRLDEGPTFCCRITPIRLAQAARA